MKTTKKLLCALLTMIMLLSLFPMAAFAIGGELTLDSITVKYNGDKTAAVGTNIDTSKIEVTANFSSGDDADVTSQATLPQDTEVKEGTNTYTVSYDNKEANFTVEGHAATITSVTISLAAPEAGNNLPTTASAGDDLTVESVSWNTEDTVAAYNTAYTARVTAKLKNGYSFGESVSASVAGANEVAVTGRDNAAGTITVKAVFNKTAKDNLTGVGQLDGISVNYATPKASVSLPETVPVTTEGKTYTSLPVDWDRDSSNYDASKPGNYTFNGTAKLPEDYLTNTSNLSLAVSVNVTVKDEAIICSADNVEVEYDGQPHTINVKVTYPSSGTTITYLQGDGSYSDKKPSYTTPGTYTISYKVVVGGLEATGSAEVKINPRTLTITAKDQKKLQGESDPTLTYSVSGLLSGHTLQGKLARQVGETAGTYAITQDTKNPLTISDKYKDYYNVTFVPGNFVITNGDAETQHSTGVKQSSTVYVLTDSKGNRVTRTFSTDGSTFSDSGAALTVGQVEQYNSNSNVTLKSTEDTKYIDSVYVGTNRLSESYYTKNGSSITVSNDYLKTLPAGGYIVSILYSDSSVTTGEIYVTSYAATVNGTSYNSSGYYSPKTGDTSNLALWIGILVACAAVIAIVAVVIVKNKKKNDAPKEKE